MSMWVIIHSWRIPQASLMPTSALSTHSEMSDKWNIASNKSLENIQMFITKLHSMWNVSHVFKCMKLKVLHQIPKQSLQVNIKSSLKHNAMQTCKYFCVPSMNAFIQIKRSLYELSQVLCRKKKKVLHSFRLFYYW